MSKAAVTVAAAAVIAVNNVAAINVAAAVLTWWWSLFTAEAYRVRGPQGVWASSQQTSGERRRSLISQPTALSLHPPPHIPISLSILTTDRISG